MHSQSKNIVIFKLICLIFISLLLMPSGIVRSATSSNPPIDISWPPEEPMNHPILENQPFPGLVDNPVDAPEDLIHPELDNRVLPEVENQHAPEQEEERYQELIHRDE